MRKVSIAAVLALLCITYKDSIAQANYKNNIKEQPIWGPVGYDHADYYFLPDLDLYYYVPKHKFIYLEDGKWLSRSKLPHQYLDYNLFKTRKIVINELQPYRHHAEFRAKYETTNENWYQQNIRDSREEKYFVIKNHPEHYKWKGNKRNAQQYNGRENVERRN